MAGFTSLLAELLGEVDHRDRARDRARAQARDAREMMDRVKDTRTFAKTLSSICAPLGDMAKATNAAVVRANDERRARARSRLASLNAEATALAASGQISGEEGAKLDFAIAAMARRIG